MHFSSLSENPIADFFFLFSLSLPFLDSYFSFSLLVSFLLLFLFNIEYLCERGRETRSGRILAEETFKGATLAIARSLFVFYGYCREGMCEMRNEKT